MLNLLAAGCNDAGSMIFLIVALVGIVALFIWQSISGKKKQQEAQNMVNALKVGDRVKTIGGICGFVVEINNNENTFVLETGTDDKKSYVKFDKGAIYQTAPKEGSAVAAKQQENQAKEEKVEAPVSQEQEVKAPKSNKKPRAKKPVEEKETETVVEEASTPVEVEETKTEE